MISTLLGKTIYLDANVFIYAVELFPRYESFARQVFAMLDTGQARGVTSAITLAEILPGPIRAANAEIELAYRDLLVNREHFQVESVSDIVLLEAARLRATTSLKLVDAIHAATAILADCDFILTNDKALRQIASPPILVVEELCGEA